MRLSGTAAGCTSDTQANAAWDYIYTKGQRAVFVKQSGAISISDPTSTTFGYNEKLRGVINDHPKDPLKLKLAGIYDKRSKPEWIKDDIDICKSLLMGGGQ